MQALVRIIIELTSSLILLALNNSKPIFRIILALFTAVFAYLFVSSIYPYHLNPWLFILFWTIAMYGVLKR